MLHIIASILIVSFDICSESSYIKYNLETELKNAAWYYPNAKEKAKNIENYIAFCKSSFYYLAKYLRLSMNLVDLLL
jgi:poly(3-hydroxyalkanoate) synthetase